MGTIRFDRERSCVSVDLVYQNRTVQVVFVPDGQEWFKVTSVTDQTGERIVGEDRYQYETVAKRELVKLFIERLKKPTSHVEVSGFAERIELAFYLRIAELTEQQRRSLSPIGKGDLELLQSMGQGIVIEYVHFKNEAKKTGHDPPDWLELKRQVLKDRRQTGLWPEERRDFYSSVLSKALAWKNNRINRRDYETAVSYRAGVQLAFSVQ